MGTPQLLCVVGALPVHDFLLLGGLNLCALDTTVPLSVSTGPADCFAAACILLHKQYRPHIAQHALLAFWQCVSDSDFSSLQPQSCIPLHQCPAGGSTKSLSSEEEKHGEKTMCRCLSKTVEWTISKITCWTFIVCWVWADHAKPTVILTSLYSMF